ncbi:MAG TPA: type 4a pilus biogenesis protein PilO [Patescibacteria group bacterium]|jgi:Tfp pilus assembly protein PilO
MKVALSGFRIKPEQRFYYLIAGNVLVLALIGFFVLRPVMGLLAEHADQITAAKADIAAARQKTDTLREVKKTLPATEAVYAPVLQSVPKHEDIAGYQTELEALAQLTRVDLVTVDTSGEQEGGNPGQAQTKLNVGGFPAFPVSIDIVGSYANVLDFVNRLETMNRFTRVTALEFVQEDSSGEVKATITAQSLYLGK